MSSFWLSPKRIHRLHRVCWGAYKRCWGGGRSPVSPPGTLPHNGCHYHMNYFIDCKDCQERYPQLAKKLATNNK